MKIDKLVLGAYENNCYICRRFETSTDCIIIDTGLDIKPLLAFLEQNKLSPLRLILTHGHADHIAGAETLRQKYSNLKLCIHKNDSSMLANAEKNLSKFSGVEITAAPADIIFQKEGPVEFIGLNFELIATAGHSPGGICLYSKTDGVLFSGDTLFCSSIGRTDFSGQDTQKCFEQLVGNIKSKLLILPDETSVLPGHGEETTIAKEKMYNPYLR